MLQFKFHELSPIKYTSFLKCFPGNFLKLIMPLDVTPKMELDVIRAPHKKDSKIISTGIASEKTKKL